MALFIIMMSWSCFKAEAVIGRRSSKIVVLQCNFWALVKALWKALEIFYFSSLFIPQAYHFTKRWILYLIIYKVYDHKSRKLFCRTYFSGCFWLVKRTNLLRKQNISLGLNGDSKIPFADKLRQPPGSDLLNGDSI